MDSNNSMKKINTTHTLFFSEPIEVDNNMLIWAKAYNCERVGFKGIPEAYKIYHERIKERLRYYLKEEGFALEGISISEWIPYNDIEKKILKVLLSMNKLRTQITTRTRKTASSWSIEINREMFRIILIYFKRKNLLKRKRTNTTSFSDFFNQFFTYNKKELNPFSRNFSLEFKTMIFNRDNYTCHYCGWKNGSNNKEDKVLTLDHIIPIAHGGTTKPENLVTSCLQCNIKKNDRLLPLIIEKYLKDKQIEKEDKEEANQLV